ncbi:MAG TPA: DUF4296 domain-containing protein [Lentimicrobium sp.]|nr:DUF4296 domain-containing protein [Lentimicrobium sp.]
MRFISLQLLTGIMLVVMFSCDDNGKSEVKPKQLIDRETMILLMADMDVTDAALKVKQVGISHDSLKKLADQAYDSLYLYYKITPEVFRQNMQYYQRDMEDFEKMVDDKISLLSRKKDSIMLESQKTDTSKIKVKAIKR